MDVPRSSGELPDLLSPQSVKLTDIAVFATNCVSSNRMNTASWGCCERCTLEDPAEPRSGKQSSYTDGLTGCHGSNWYIRWRKGRHLSFSG